MTITGYLSEFSLAELFRFLDQGYKTGLLILKPETDLPYYICYYYTFHICICKCVMPSIGSIFQVLLPHYARYRYTYIVTLKAFAAIDAIKVFWCFRI